MVFDMNLVWLGIALLLAPALGEMAKIRSKGEKGFTWIAAGGAMYLLAASFSFDIPNLSLGTNLTWGTTLFSVIGLIAVLIGAIVVLTNVFK